MSAATVELIAEAANLAESAPPADRHESTRRLAVAAHWMEGRVRQALHGRIRARRTGLAPLPEPGVDLARLRRELRIAGRRQALRCGLQLAIAGLVPLLGATEPMIWIAAAAALFAVELGFRMARRRYVRSRLGPEEYAAESPRVPAGRNGGGRTKQRPLVGTPVDALPGTGEDLGSIVLAVDLGKPVEAGRVPRHLRVADLEHDLKMTVRRLWLARLEITERWYAERRGARARRYVVFELPVGEEGGLLSALVRFDRRGDVLLTEARFRFLPPISRVFRGDGPLNPLREAGGLVRDIAVSLGCSPFRWLGALGWLGSGVVHPVVAAIRAEDGVQERSLRERFGCCRPAPVLEAEVKQMTAAIRARLLDEMEQSLVRRGICPGPVQACATRGDVVVVEDSPARALPRRRRSAPRRRGPGRRRCA